MTSIYDFALTPAANTASPPDGFAENQLPSQVDDTFRATMAKVGEFAHSTAAGGSADALTVTLSNVPSSLTDGMEIHVRAAAANATTTPTLNLNALGAKTITKLGGGALSAGDIAGNLHELLLRYNLANTRWELLNPAIVSSPNISLTFLTSSLSGDVSLNNVSNYFDGPSISQGTSGTWLVTGQITVTAAAEDTIDVKLWDGTTVIASAQATTQTGGSAVSFGLSGIIAAPAGALRISAKDVTNTGGTIKFNASGNSKDSTISAVRIQ